MLHHHGLKGPTQHLLHGGFPARLHGEALPEARTAA